MGKMYRKLALRGGEGGREWDDDVYEGVKKVYVGQDLSRITYIKFEYVKEDGEVVTREYGTITQDPREFIIEYPDEHITAVEGSYNKVALIATEVITSLVFKTSKGRTSPTFGPNLFGVKIVGFHGRSDNAIDALGVYLVLDSLTTPFPLYKLDAQGGTEGRVWDDGSFDGVRAVRVCQDDHRITYLEFEYDKGGKSEKLHHGVKGGTSSEFVLDCPNEYIKSVEVTYDEPKLFQNTVITSLTFQTSSGRTSFFGYKVGKKFVLEQKDHRLVGFHGKEGDAIDALGAYFAPIQAPTPLIPTKKLPSVGGNGGVKWDDGVFDGVRKISIGQCYDVVSYVKFDYIKGTELVSGDEHGETLPEASEFVIEYPDEHITAVEGSHNKVALIATEVITSLVFKTSKGRTSPTFGPNLFGVVNGTKFKFEDEGKKIVGFHGRSDKAVDALGVYLELDSLTTPFPIYKLEAQGGKEGSVWDDGCFDGVRTVRVGQDDCRITYLEFEYVKGARFETRHHGVKGETQSEFVVNFMNEHITLVEATYDNPKLFRNTVITSLKFETSRGRTAIFGYEVGKKFVLGQNGKIKIGLYEEGIAFVKFVYIKGNGLVTGDDHGKITSLGAEEIVLENGEYLTGIEGYYRPIPRAPFGKTVSIKFKTNKRETPLYGLDSGEKYSFEEKGHKITGFHGRATTDVIYSIEAISRPF
ncbi:hypothetical protein Bca52824_044883 [Brassica carinata]|uniref:Jacalin-type lectin domain-containing protein n=1 Tax=Brassica carinata TaxID=52824 RepID=A0A8X7RH68_BRACI|nr:hypothetical protein Bca52824_044883 [Brassica carinata]